MISPNNLRPIHYWEAVEKYLLNKISVLNDIIHAQDEYIKLLGKEIDSMVMLCHIHGWESSNVEEGIKCHEKIETLKSLLK